MAGDQATRPPSLELLDPLLGEWVAEGESPTGPYSCRRLFVPILDGNNVRLETDWEYGSRSFQELTIFAAHETHGLQYFSFSSNGEQSVGRLSSAGGLSEDAMVFESSTPTGRLRHSYWPTGLSGVMMLVIDSRSRKGWTRVAQHRYRPVG